jgi:AraC-like DNA-binding protein
VNYRELAPAVRLRRYVRCYWALDAAAPDGTAAQRVLPDGCVEVIINLGAQFLRYDAAGRIERQPRTLLVGPTTRHMSIAPTGAIRLVGIRFAPGGALPFLAASPAELCDAAPPLDDVGLRFEPGLPERLAGAHGGTEASILDQALLAQLDRARRYTDRRVTASVRAAFAMQRPLRVDALVQLTGWGPRQLERQFRNSVGFGPKTLCRLARFQRVVRAVESAGEGTPGWAQLALDSGYADQSHLAREFREFAGTTLTGYVRELHPMSDHFHTGTLGEEPLG